VVHSVRVKHPGSCHCGAVRFEIDHNLTGAARCNCSVCTKVGGTTVNLPPEKLELLGGESDLTAYEWGGKTAKRYFCKHCGVTVFSRGELEQLGGKYVSVNINTLEGVDPNVVPVEHYDGRHDNWMAGTRPQPWPIL
jgi:hypothetical protein